MRHAAGARRAAALALLPLLVACGGAASSAAPSTAPATGSPTGSVTGSPSPTGTATGTALPSASASTSGCITKLEITVRGNQVTPRPGTVDVRSGCQVEMLITADRANELHVHVADLVEKVAAGRPLTVAFTAGQPGVYEVELHDPELLLVKLAVR